MGIFGQQVQNQVTPQIMVAGLYRSNRMEFDRRVQFVKQGFDAIWNNPRFSAKEMVDALGTNAVLIFTNHSAEQQRLMELAAQGQADGLAYTVLVPKFKCTPNQDGSITVDMNLPYGA